MADEVQNPFEEIGAHFVAGELIAVIDKKHVVLGKLNLGQLLLTEEGHALYQAASTPEPEAPKTRKGQEKTLDVTDTVETADKMG